MIQKENEDIKSNKYNLGRDHLEADSTRYGFIIGTDGKKLQQIISWVEKQKRENYTLNSRFHNVFKFANE